ncbi:MAG: hypothetical protein ACX930_11985 [Erythrobacter sp.]
MTPPIQEMSKFAGEREQTSELAPENHNSEQVDLPSQAQQVAAQAKEHEHNATGATESEKPSSPGIDNLAGHETDVIDQMRDMEETGAIDNGAYEGEPNHDDNVDKYA